jgi:hypothetical protein
MSTTFEMAWQLFGPGENIALSLFDNRPVESARKPLISRQKVITMEAYAT